MKKQEVTKSNCTKKKKKMKCFEFLEHTADAKFKAYGRNLEHAFMNAAYAMSSIMYEHRMIAAKIIITTR